MLTSKVLARLSPRVGETVQLPGLKCGLVVTEVTPTTMTAAVGGDGKAKVSYKNMHIHRMCMHGLWMGRGNVLCLVKDTGRGVDYDAD
jgi:hypothetical protein